MEVAESTEYPDFAEACKHTCEVLVRAGTTVAELTLAALVADKKLGQAAKRQKIMSRLNKIEAWEKTFKGSIRTGMCNTIVDAAMAVITN